MGERYHGAPVGATSGGPFRVETTATRPRRWLALVLAVALVVAPLAAVAPAPQESEAAGPSIFVAGVGWVLLTSPWGMAALAAAAVGTGAVLCMTEVDCQTVAQEFWASSSGWMVEYFAGQLAAGASDFRWTDAAGYSEAEYLAALDAVVALGWHVHIIDAQATGSPFEGEMVVTSASLGVSPGVKFAEVMELGIPASHVDVGGESRATRGIQVGTFAGDLDTSAGCTTTACLALRTTVTREDESTAGGGLANRWFQGAPTLATDWEIQSVTWTGGNPGVLADIEWEWRLTGAFNEQRVVVPDMAYRWLGPTTGQHSIWFKVSALDWMRSDIAALEGILTGPAPGADPNKRVMIPAGSVLALWLQNLLGPDTIAENVNGGTSTLADPATEPLTQESFWSNSLGALNGIRNGVQTLINSAAQTVAAVQSLPQTMMTALTAAVVPTVGVGPRWQTYTTLWETTPPIVWVTPITTAFTNLWSGGAPQEACFTWQWRTWDAFELCLGDQVTGAVGVVRNMSAIVLALFLAMYVRSVWVRFTEGE